MKKVIFFALLVTAVTSVKCQELVFKMNQFASASKNNKTGKLKDAEVNNVQTTILFSPDKVAIEGDVKAIYTLSKKASQTKVSNRVVSYSYNGIDENKYPVSFMYTVNLASKEAVVEIAHDQLKDFYFGTFSSSDLTVQR